MTPSLKKQFHRYRDIVKDRLSVPTDAMPIAIFRMVLGLCCCYWAHRYIDPEVIRIYAHHFETVPYRYLSWVRPGPEWALTIIFYSGLLAAVGITIGLFYRLSLAIFGLVYIYVFLFDATYYNNHFYMVILLLFIFLLINAHQQLSIDAKRKVMSDQVPQWQVWLPKFQVLVVYFYGGLAKIQWDWLRGEPAQILVSENVHWPIIGALFSHPVSPFVFAYAALAFDLLIGPMLIYAKTRVLAIVLTLIFHITNHFWFNIGVFPWLMLGANVLFINPRVLRKGLSVLRLSQKGPASNVSVPLISNGQLTVVMGFVVFQLLFPLRHWQYPGNASWTGQGDHFAWRMMLGGKEVKEAIFYISDVSDSSPVLIDMSHYLSRQSAPYLRPQANTSDPVAMFHEIEQALNRERNLTMGPLLKQMGIPNYKPPILTRYEPLQFEAIVKKPNLIWRLVQAMEAELIESGMTDPVIKARIKLRLNLREYQYFVDPTVDLTEVRNPLFSAHSFIMPLKPRRERYD